MRPAAALSLLALATAAAGCGGSGGPKQVPRGAPPAGFARYDADGISFDRPAAWTHDTPAPGLQEFYGTPGQGGFPPQVAIGAAKARNTLRDAVRFHKDTQKIRFPSYRVTTDEPRRLAGAEGAQLIDARYTVQKPGAEKVLLREVNLLVLTNDGRQLDFFVRSPAADYSGAKLDAIVNSFRLR
jgi:hypothetical protein